MSRGKRCFVRRKQLGCDGAKVKHSLSTAINGRKKVRWEACSIYLMKSLVFDRHRAQLMHIRGIDSYVCHSVFCSKDRGGFIVLSWAVLFSLCSCLFGMQFWAPFHITSVILFQQPKWNGTQRRMGNKTKLLEPKFPMSFIANLWVWFRLEAVGEGGVFYLEWLLVRFRKIVFIFLFLFFFLRQSRYIHIWRAQTFVKGNNPIIDLMGKSLSTVFRL